MFILKMKIFVTFSICEYRLTINDRSLTTTGYSVINYLLRIYHLWVSVIYLKNKYQQMVKVVKRQ